MTYQPQPIKTEGGQKETRVSDDNVQQLLAVILDELRKLNTQLALMNDTIVQEGESLQE